MSSKKDENMSYNERMSGGKKKKKMPKLQVMDIVTIVFSVIIVGIMIYVVATQFDFGGDDKDKSATANPSATTAPSATAAPDTTMTDIGTWYGNILAGSSISKQDDRFYYISKDADGDTGIFVKYGDVVKQLVKDDAKDLNVVHDKKSYAGQAGVKAYYVFYIDESGRICYVYDGPIGDGQSGTQTMQTPTVLIEGSHSNLMVSGQYLYFLNEDSVICRYDFVNKTEKVLSKYTYSEFVVYFGAIYGIRKADNFIYQVSTSGRSDSTTATATPSATPSVTYEGEDDAYEFRLVKEACSGFAVEDNWLYAIIGEKIVRFDADTGEKDTLGAVKPEMINVYGKNIVYLSEGKLYCATAEELIVGKTNEICAINITAINMLDTTTIYVVNADDGKLYSSTYNEESGYSAFAEVK